MRVLITGAAGFIGSHLSRACLELGHSVHGVDSFTDYYSASIKRQNVSGLRDQPRWALTETDLVTTDIRSLLADVDIVFHLAAQPGVRSSWGQTFDAYVNSNVTALQRLLEAARHADVSRLVFASSSSVYGDAQDLPTTESTALQPVSPYGATKVLGEHLCRLYYRSFALPVVTVRYFTVYGPNQRPDMAFHRMINAALTGSEITVNGDGRQTRDFTFVADAVTGTLAAARHGKPGSVFNLGGGTRTSIREVLALIADLTKESLRIQYAESQAGDARDTAADTTRAREVLGFTPAHSLSDGLGRQIAWHHKIASNRELASS